MRAACTKFAHQRSCGWVLYFSHWLRETPPTRIIHSPCGTLAFAAGTHSANAIATSAISGRNRLVMITGQHYLCGQQNLQLSGMRRSACFHLPSRIDLVTDEVV